MFQHETGMRGWVPSQHVAAGAQAQVPATGEEKEEDSAMVLGVGVRGADFSLGGSGMGEQSIPAPISPGSRAQSTSSSKVEGEGIRASGIEDEVKRTDEPRQTPSSRSSVMEAGQQRPGMAAPALTGSEQSVDLSPRYWLISFECCR